jgi:acetylornithine deacetylase/succinyl-diaminopimelate desuccinylase-like protein
MHMNQIDRRTMLQTSALAAAAMALPETARAGAGDIAALRGELAKNHDANIRRLQDWIRLPSIAAENRGYPAGAEHMATLLRDAGFAAIEIVPTDGKPGVFARLDAGARRTVGIYFMYDVKQADPAEWSSPPFEGALVDKPGLGKCIVGRGAVNQKGPEATFLAALHAFKSSGRKLPVNLVLVAEGEEEIGSPHFHQVVHRPDIAVALKTCDCVFMPFASQGADGGVTVNLGAKGIIELELVASGAKWGRGPKGDIHSSLKASIDSPAWRLVEALATLVSPDGNTPMIDGYMDKVRPLTPADKALIADYARRTSETATKKSFGVEHWVGDVSWEQAVARNVGMPTVNIEGLVAGYTGPGGKTILPGRAVAKIDMRLVPDMTAEDSLAKLKAHLAKRGYGDIEVNMSGGYDPTTTSINSPLIRTEIASYKAAGINPVINPRLAGSWPGYLFTAAPLEKPAGHFGFGLGNGAHAPNEYYVITSANPKVRGFDDAALGYAEFLYALAVSA